MGSSGNCVSSQVGVEALGRHQRLAKGRRSRGRIRVASPTLDELEAENAANNNGNSLAALRLAYLPPLVQPQSGRRYRTVAPIDGRLLATQNPEAPARCKCSERA